MKEMDDLVPDSAKTLFDEGIEQSKHRRNIESKVIPAQVNQSLVGQIGGFISGMSALYIAWDLAKSNHEQTATAIAAVVVALVGTFIWGKRKQKEDLDSKSD